MGLETGSFISDLNASNPIDATDQVAQGDDHIRLIKSVLKSQFPNLNAAVNFTPTEANYLDGLTGVTGTGNLVASGSPTFTGDVTVNTIGGIASANLVDKSAAESISGAWSFGALTATSYDGVLAANLLDKSAPETVTGAWTFSGSVALNGTVTGLSSADLSDVATIAMLDENETVTGVWTFNDRVDIGDEFVTDGVASVGTTGTINALSSANVSVIRMTGAALTTINGIANGVAGKRLVIINLTSSALQMNSESGSASAANRLRFAATASISVNDAFEFIYDGVSSRWQLIGF
jgi:hypothetical protein